LFWKVIDPVERGKGRAHILPLMKKKKKKKYLGSGPVSDIGAISMEVMRASCLRVDMIGIQQRAIRAGHG